MSIKSKVLTEVYADTINMEVDPSREITSDVSVNEVITCSTKEIKATRKEYSIVGDQFYISISGNDAPSWLTDIINSTVQTSVDNGLTDYNDLVQDVRNAIDSIDVAKNTYVEQINFSTLVDGIVATHLQTLNASHDGKFATIVDLDIAKADSESALVTRIADLQASFSADINSRISIIQNAYSSADQAFADSIEALTVAFSDQEAGISGLANAVTGLQTYVGLDSTTSNPNGFGILARIDVLEKQSDGIVDIISNTYDVMIGVSDPNTNVGDDQLDVTKEPYASWIATDNQYDIDNNLSGTTNERSLHVGDVYIMYTTTPDGGKTYIKSYKFIRTEVDSTSPYATDTEGFTWAVIADTDTQAIYVTALEARDMADGKISNFYAWSDMEGGGEPTNYSTTSEDDKYKVDSQGNYLDTNNNITTNPEEYVVLPASSTENVSAENVVLWFTNGILYKKGTTWADKTAVPVTPGNGSFIAEGDLLTVFDPVTGDISLYHYNNGSWVINGPTGIFSKSKWFVDLDNEVTGVNGHVAKSLNNLEITSKAYSNETAIGVENKFAYDSTIILDGKIYEAGFGLDTTGVSQVGRDGLTYNTRFDSKFRINSEKFVLTNPAHPGIEAKFQVTATGLLLSVDQTEATKNIPKGIHVQTNTYDNGDIVLSNGSSYLAIVDVPANTPVVDEGFWVLMAEKGESAYEIWVKEPDNVGKTKAEFLESLNAEDGINGNTWYSYSGGVPPSGLGIDGDFTLRDSRYVYKKISGTWQYQYDLKGSTGSTGVGVSSMHTTYRYGNSATNIATGTYTSISGAGGPTASYPYLWKKIVTTYSNSQTATIYELAAIKGTDGTNGTNGTNGSNGSNGTRGAANLNWNFSLNYSVSTMVSSKQSTLTSYWNSAANYNSSLTSKVVGDTLVLSNTGTLSQGGWVHIFTWTGSSWSALIAQKFDGNVIVDGTLLAKHLAANSVTADKITFNSAYLSTESGLLSVASLTDIGNGKVFGNSTGTQTPAILIPAGGKVVLHGTLTAFGTTTESSSVSYTGAATTNNLSYVSIGSQISVGNATGISCLLGGCQFVLTATNSSTITRWVRFKVNMSTSSITSPDSSLIYSYLTTKR